MLSSSDTILKATGDKLILCWVTFLVCCRQERVFELVQKIEFTLPWRHNDELYIEREREKSSNVKFDVLAQATSSLSISPYCFCQKLCPYSLRGL